MTLDDLETLLAERGYTVFSFMRSGDDKPARRWQVNARSRAGGWLIDYGETVEAGARKLLASPAVSGLKGDTQDEMDFLA